MLLHVDVLGFRARKGIAAIFVIVGSFPLISGHSLAQEAAVGATRTIERKSVAPQADQNEARFATREGRLRAKPLDWNATTGKRGTPQAPTPAEEESVKSAKPSFAPGGASDPKSQEEAKRLYPDEWR